MTSKFLSYIMVGIWYFISVLPFTIVIYAIIITFRYFITHGLPHFNKHILAEFCLISHVMTTLKITGIIGMQFNISWFLNSFSFSIFKSLTSGSLLMMSLNLLLFTPFGFLFPIVINKCNLIKTFLLSLLFSISIEILQMFAGRMSEVDDIIMNTFGTLIGFAFYKLLKSLLKNKHECVNT